MVRQVDDGVGHGVEGGRGRGRQGQRGTMMVLEDGDDDEPIVRQTDSRMGNEERGRWWMGTSKEGLEREGRWMDARGGIFIDY